MDALSILCVLIGVLILLTRGPLIFAPAATFRVFRRLVSTDLKVRVLGLSFAPLAVALVALPLGSGTVAKVLVFFGWVWCAAAVWLLVAPGSYRRVAYAIFDVFEGSDDDSAARAIGVVAVAIAVGLIYLGLNVA